jgi:hypothetical protein
LQGKALLSDVFERDGWSIDHDTAADMVFRRQGAGYVVELKVGAEGDRIV